MMQSSRWQKETNKDELLILILKSGEEFAALETHWNALQKRALQFGTPFHQAFKQWKLVNREGQHDLFVITIWDGTLLIGVAPLYLNYFKLNNSVVSFKNMIPPSNQYSVFIPKIKQYRISNFSTITVDSSYLNIFAERLIDVIEPACLYTNLLELKCSDGYANEYLCSGLQKKFPTVN